MKNKKGFVISTTLYSIFGIMLIVIFYILYMLSNNRMLLTTSTNELKSELESKATTLDAYGIDKYPETIGALVVEVKQEKGIEEIKYIYDFYDESVHTTNYMKNLTTATTYCSNSDSDTSNDCVEDETIELDVLDNGYSGCTNDPRFYYHYTCRNYTCGKGYAEETLDNKSYIFYVKDSLNQESIYLVTPKVKIEYSGNATGPRDSVVLAVIDNHAILSQERYLGSDGRDSMVYYTIIKGNEVTHESTYLPTQHITSIKVSDDYIYSITSFYSSHDSTSTLRYQKIPLLNGMMLSIEKDEYDNAASNYSKLHTVADNVIEHPFENENIKILFTTFISKHNSCKYWRDTDACDAGYSNVGEVVFKYNDQYTIFAECYNHGAGIFTFETKPEVVVTKK